MTVTDYRGGLERYVEDRQHNSVLVKVAFLLSGFAPNEELNRRCGGDPSGVNDVIDALLDEYLATVGGDMRLGLFFALSAFGAQFASAGRRG